jgi:hypothetical protein
MSLHELLAELDRRARLAEQEARKAGRGSKPEQLAGRFRAAAAALREAEAIEAGTQSYAPPTPRTGG